MFGASNELPSEEDELEALYDRFLLRYVVDYIKEDFRFLKLLQDGDTNRDGAIITQEELEECKSTVNKVTIPSNIIKLIGRIRTELKNKGLSPSDRRYKQSISLLKAKAFLEGRDKVSEDDLHFLENVYWRDPGEKTEIQSVIHQALHGYKDRLRELVIQAKELDGYSKREWDNEEMSIKANIEAQTKLKQIVSSVNELIEECEQRGKSIEDVNKAKIEIENIQKDILDRLVSGSEEMA
jgi:MoxR-like ATPase